LTPEQPDYFSNHRLKLRFPWKLYHGPIVDGLRRAVALSPGPDVLNVGSGPFLELRQLAATPHRFTVCDTDPRAVQAAADLHGVQLVGADVIAPNEPLPYPSGRFDLVASMDVIEHVPNPTRWLTEIFRVLKSGGLLFLTTPNYASLSLNVIEGTALEAIARLQGFSRKHIHPSKMTKPRLEGAFRDAGAGSFHIELLAHGWVLSALARKT
jgi:SAM-dependent methyltransferase